MVPGRGKKFMTERNQKLYLLGAICLFAYAGLQLLNVIVLAFLTRGQSLASAAIAFKFLEMGSFVFAGIVMILKRKDIMLIIATAGLSCVSLIGFIISPSFSEMYSFLLFGAMCALCFLSGRISFRKFVIIFVCAVSVFFLVDSSIMLLKYEFSHFLLYMSSAVLCPLVMMGAMAAIFAVQLDVKPGDPFTNLGIIPKIGFWVFVGGAGMTLIFAIVQFAVDGWVYQFGTRSALFTALGVLSFFPFIIGGSTIPFGVILPKSDGKSVPCAEPESNVKPSPYTVKPQEKAPEADAASVSMPSDSELELLTKLKALKDADVISEEEFTEKKKQILKL